MPSAQVRALESVTQAWDGYWMSIRWPSKSCPRLGCYMVISILYPHRKFWRSSHGTKFPRNFKRPKNGEDGSDFDDFWTKRIAALSAKFWKNFGPSKKFPRGRKIRKKIAKSSKNFGPYTVFGTKQNRNVQISLSGVRTFQAWSTCSWGSLVKMVDFFGWFWVKRIFQKDLTSMAYCLKKSSRPVLPTDVLKWLYAEVV